MSDPPDRDSGEEIPDPLPDLIANLDQAVAMAPHLAKMAMGWYDAFLGQGFDPKQSLYLTAVQIIQHPGSP